MRQDVGEGRVVIAATVYLPGLPPLVSGIKGMKSRKWKVISSCSFHFYSSLFRQWDISFENFDAKNMEFENHLESLLPAAAMTMFCVNQSLFF